ncbi:succinyl-CoA--3-ketoacid-CoA transferase [Gordonia pseudamarae]|jgi:3-oxoacid CoA-transferase subunit A|uniref:Succinyl-CoA--3-ketoacid-CoA transferase n=1 Tax=Gordonia pseudamarae TaxID=2831662 RepID=A0ABX6IF32_9ACTN|nr:MULTISPECIES: CoA transferase subunit A [Gordonia]MBD0022296.1 CoA transferase subunit A [Gordonia sp. (in: high G+C Gram-positive bacteria)]QHN25001.1 succinyl-CoA--3-ketoacid-CoA transferase [Gordonia pseudamarae]QHN33936.1 succinyl-CoA--3-ketoacid-CoA transferase [Gordonia pseudamarae]
MDKEVSSAAAAVRVVEDSMTIATGGFGVCGIPTVLLAALAGRGSGDLTVISNNCGIAGVGNSLLLENRQIRKLIASYVGENKELERQYLAGEIEIELNPQGTLAERLRAGGAGIAAFFTQSGVGTVVAEGGLPIRYAADGSVAVASAPKRVERFDWRGTERDFVLEHALYPDVALIRAWKGDRHGNLLFRKAARNFNPMCAMAAKVTIAEVEDVVEPGVLDPDDIHLPGVYVNQILPLSVHDVAGKGIERRTVRTHDDSAIREGAA